MKARILQSVGIFMWIIYAFSLFGILAINPLYLSTLNTTIRTVVSIVLMIRFRPSWAYNRKMTFTMDDWSFVFSASFYLFATTTLNTLLLAKMTRFFDFVRNRD